MATVSATARAEPARRRSTAVILLRSSLVGALVVLLVGASQLHSAGQIAAKIGADSRRLLNFARSFGPKAEFARADAAAALAQSQAMPAIHLSAP
jgi:hypothetical protein